MAISSNATGLRPGVCTSTTRPTTPYTGQIIYETDTGYLRVWDGSAWDYFSPAQATIPGAWTSYTPTQSALTLGNGTSSWYYTEVNKMVTVLGYVGWGSTTSLNNDWTVTLPSTAAAAEYCGSVNMRDAGTRIYVGTVFPETTTTFRLGQSESGNFGIVNATNPFTWTTNDQMWVQLTYRVA